MKHSVMAFAVVLVSVLTPGRTQAQDCGQIVFGCGGGGGTESAHTANSGPNSYWKYPHSGCSMCAVPMPECHPYCVDTHEDAAAYVAIMTAAAAGDVSRVVGLARTVKGYVFFNAERRSIQVMSCSKTTIVANLPIRDVAVLAKAISLPPNVDPLRLLTYVAP